MSVAEYLPRPPAPPHDPLSLILDKRVGWSVLTSTLIRAHESLVLARFPGSLRWLTESSGSFGGLRTPRNVAIGPGGDILLLDADSHELKIFDACQCAFVRLLCFEKPGPELLVEPCVTEVTVKKVDKKTFPALRLPEVAGIALSADSLYVCDPENERVSIFALPTLVPRGQLRYSAPWQPTCALIVGRAVYVGDKQNGVVHRFDRQGVRIDGIGGFGPIENLAIDAYGQVYAATLSNAYLVTETGPVAVSLPADELAEAFPTLPFQVDRDGNLHLGPLCVPPSDKVFDPTGEAITLGASSPIQLYEFEGSVVLGPFDSRIESCIWHRIILHGEMPAGCQITAKTHAADIAFPSDMISTLPDYAWETNLGTTTFEDGEWDCLIQGRPGRYLWLGLTLRSDGAATPSMDAIEIEFPRISLRRFMPAIYGAETVSADFTDRLLGILDRELRDQELRLDNLPALFDPMATDQLDWLASWVGVTLDRQLPESLRRELLASSSRSQGILGTPTGLRSMLLTFLGIDKLETTCQSPVPPNRCGIPAQTCPVTPDHVWQWTPPPLILEHFRLRRWLEVGKGRLGDQAVLWGRNIVNRSQLGRGATVGLTQINGTQDPARDSFHVYAHKFTVFVPACAGNTPQKRRSLESLVRREAPAHTLGQIQYVSPRFRIGFQSMIGLDSVVACLPSGVRLNETPIGPASVLTGGVDQNKAGSTRIGEAQI